MRAGMAAAAVIAVAMQACAATAPAVTSSSREGTGRLNAFEVKVSGRGRPILLIPGLSSTGEVWDQTVESLQQTHECHVVTLAGFGGRPRVEGPFLPRVRDELIAYVKARGLERPILVGHSLGGTLALWIAATEPTLVGGVVAVDGVPFLPALVNPSVNEDASRPQAEALRQRYQAMSAEQFAQANQAALQAMVTSPEDLSRLLRTANSSDPSAVGQAVAELLSNDLRDDVAAIRAPVLLLAAAPWATTPQLQAGAVAAYEAQLANVPQRQVVLVPNARHFLMYDAPAELNRHLAAFLGGAR